MSAQDNMEKVLRELHVLLSKSNPYERDSNYLVVNKKEMLDILKQLAVCMSEVMDEELKSLLQDLKDTDKYMGIIEERNKKIAKEKKWKEEDTESSPYAAVKPEIKINRDYFEQQGISFEEPEEEQPEEKTEKAAPEISVNLDSEYFKWKEQEGKEGDPEDEKQPEKKGFFGKFMK